MSYVVLARKWRPMSFNDLVGQDHVSRTLGNAIASGRIAHAFLFTGVRGVGKTTSARILAKALNCLGDPDKGPTAALAGPTAEPCLKCAACREITDGTDVDVQEIDGASYNGVDEVKRLQDSLPYRPLRDRYKIFIVDEVHMLSQAAWNAFLKTLEEPPPHVKFIFATTDVHKVPVTILSRVQRFDFKLISAGAIAARLEHVLAAEGISAEKDAVATLAREAAGSMRDAMSLLDQVIAFNSKELLAADVSQVLGVASRQVLYRLTEQLIAGDAQVCLGIVADLANQGFDMPHVARDVLGLLRDIVVSNVCRDTSGLLDLPDQEQNDVKRLAAAAPAEDLIRLHLGFSRGFDDVVRSGQARAALEMLLIRLARRPALIPIDDLVARLSTLEQRLSGRGTGSPSNPTPRGGPAGPRPSVPPTRSSGSPSSARELAGTSAAPAIRSDDQRQASGSEPESPVVATPLAESAASSRAESSRAESSRVESSRGKSSRSEMSANGGSSSAPPPESDANGASAQPDTLAATWRSIVNRVWESRPDLASRLQHLMPLALSGQELVLGLEKDSVFEHLASSKETQALLQRVGLEHFGSSPKVSFRHDVPKQETQTLAEVEAGLRDARRTSAVERVRKHPRVVDAVEILGARIKEIKLGEDTPESSRSARS